MIQNYITELSKNADNSQELENLQMLMNDPSTCRPFHQKYLNDLYLLRLHFERHSNLTKNHHVATSFQFTVYNKIYDLHHTINSLVKIIDTMLYCIEKQWKNLRWNLKYFMNPHMIQQLLCPFAIIASLHEQKQVLLKWISLLDLKDRYQNNWYYTSYDMLPLLRKEIQSTCVLDFYFIVPFYCLSIDDSFQFKRLYFGDLSVGKIEKRINDRKEWFLVTQSEEEAVLQHPLLPYPKHFVSVPTQINQSSIQFRLSFPHNYLMN